MKHKAAVELDCRRKVEKRTWWLFACPKWLSIAKLIDQYHFAQMAGQMITSRCDNLFCHGGLVHKGGQTHRGQSIPLPVAPVAPRASKTTCQCINNP